MQTGTVQRAIHNTVTTVCKWYNRLQSMKHMRTTKHQEDNSEVVPVRAVGPDTPAPAWNQTTIPTLSKLWHSHYTNWAILTQASRRREIVAIQGSGHNMRQKPFKASTLIQNLRQNRSMTIHKNESFEGHLTVLVTSNKNLLFLKCHITVHIKCTQTLDMLWRNCSWIEAPCRWC